MTTKTMLVISLGGVALVLLAIGGGLLTLRESCRDFKAGKVTVGAKIWNIAVARTSVEQERGLAGCKRMPKDSGLYFVFGAPRPVTFWMKKMLMPIDIVWIAEGRVVGIESDLRPVDTLVVEPPLYQPPRPVDAVLEVPANTAVSAGIKIGDDVRVEVK